MALFSFRVDDLLPPFSLFDHVSTRIAAGKALSTRAQTPRVIFYLKGSADLCIRGQVPLRIGPGCAVAFREFCEYEYRSVPRNAAVELRAIRLRLQERPAAGGDAPMERFESEVWKLMDLFEAPCSFFQGVLGPEVLNLVHRVESEASRDGLTQRAMASGLCLELLAVIARLRGDGTHTKAMPTQSRGAGLHLCEQFIQEHLSEHIALEAVAAHVGWSKEHLARRFREERGETVGQFIRSRRVAIAKEMLAQRTGNLERIAQACGFTDAAHFGKVFKEATGTSPGAFRQHLLERSSGAAHS